MRASLLDGLHDVTVYGSLQQPFARKMDQTAVSEQRARLPDWSEHRLPKAEHWQRK